MQTENNQDNKQEPLRILVFSIFTKGFAEYNFRQGSCIRHEKNGGKVDFPNMIAFMNLKEAAKPYPCMKKAWVEFLGEQTDSVTERAE